MTQLARSRTVWICGMLLVSVVLYLKFNARSEDTVVERDVRSDDGRCVCWLTEYDEPKDGYRTFDLRIELDGHTVQTRSYLGTKRMNNALDKFVVGQTGPFYFLYVDGVPEYAVVAVDGGNGVVWFQSSTEQNEYIYRIFKSNAGMSRLTDLNSLNAFVLNN